MPTGRKHRAERGARLFAVSTLGAALVLAAIALLVPGRVTAVGLFDRLNETSGQAGRGATGDAMQRSAARLGRFAVTDPARQAREPQRESEPPPKPLPSAGRPVELGIPELGVRAPVVGIVAADRLLTPPDDPQVLGWWSAGAPAGAAAGGTLITGHTVSSGGGAFDELETLSGGDEVTVRTTRGTVRYAVTRTVIYSKASLADHAERVFSQEVPGRLVLVTCEDWNGETYLSNVIVFAEPVPG